MADHCTVQFSGTSYILLISSVLAYHSIKIRLEREISDISLFTDFDTNAHPYFVLIAFVILFIFYFSACIQVMHIVEYDIIISNYVNSQPYSVSYTDVQKRILRNKAASYKL